MNGQEVKALIKGSGLKCWQVAEEWGLCDSNFSRKLRKPFTADEVKRLKDTISKLTKANENASC